MTDTKDDRARLAEGAHTAFAGEMSYGDYLALDAVLTAQHPRSTSHNELLFIVQHQDAGLRAAEDQGVDVVGALVGVHRLEVHHVADDVNSSEMPLPPCMSRAMRAMSSALPQELRLIEVISTGAAVPSSFMRPRRRQPAGRA
jgi:hypothetical protein